MDRFSRIYNRLCKIVGPEFWAPGATGISKSGSFMDLHYEYLRSERIGDYAAHVISLAHYYEQNGDLVRDPDVEIRIIPELKMAEALNFQDSFGCRDVYPKPGYVDLRAKREVNAFLEQWLKNLKDQKHHIAKPEPEPRQPPENAVISQENRVAGFMNKQSLGPLGRIKGV